MRFIGSKENLIFFIEHVIQEMRVKGNKVSAWYNISRVNEYSLKN